MTQAKAAGAARRVGDKATWERWVCPREGCRHRVDVRPGATEVRHHCPTTKPGESRWVRLERATP